MEHFRRCIFRASCHAFPRIPLRRAVSFFKSYLGKDVSEGIHRARRRLQHGGR
jgi:hypothetical protein